MRTQPHRGFVAALGVVLAVAGCASFKDQTTVAEPHGLVVIAQGPDIPDEPVVERLDGLPVSAGREYRVRPGVHQVIIRIVERGVATYKPVTIGTGQPEPPATVTMPVSGGFVVSDANPYQSIQPVQFNIEERRFSYITNAITVEPGWRYELDGDRVNKERQP